MKAHNKALQVAILVALVVLPKIAFAQNMDAPSIPPVPYAPYADPAVVLDLVGDGPMTITVYPMSERTDPDRPLFSCRAPCRVRILPGKYRFHVRGNSGKVESDRVVEVRTAEQLSFSLPDESTKNAGLTMAITGTVLIPAGLLVALASAMSNACFDCQSDEYRNRTTPAGVYVGLGMFVAGAILTPVGWVQFARNRKPHVEETPLVPSSGIAPTREARKAPVAPAPHVGFSVAPTRGGAFAGLSGSF